MQASLAELPFTKLLDKGVNLENLIALAKQGDQNAIEQIVNQYKGLIRSLANKFYLVGGNKEDLLQEGMLGLFYAINGYDQTKGAFPAFAKLCVTRQILDAVQRDGAEKNRPLANYVEIELMEDVEDQSSPLQNLLSKEYAQKVATVIKEHLTQTERKVLQLFASGYTYEDIMKCTNKSYKAVDGALQRARKKLIQFM